MTALTCLLCGFFLDVGASAHRSIDPPAPTTLTVVNGAGETIYEGPFPGVYRYDINRTRNPYGVLALGYQFDLSRKLQLTLKLQHESSLSTGRDRGTNSAQLVMRWSPFRSAL